MHQPLFELLERNPELIGAWWLIGMLTVAGCILALKLFYWLMGLEI